MLRSLKKRPRPDTLQNDVRRSGGVVGRRVYLGLLAVFFLGVANYLWGDFLMLRGDGLVVRDRTVVAATFVARVAEVDVAEGQMVKEGDHLLRIESAEVLERLADLSIRQAELAQRAAAFQLRSEVATQLLPMATRHAQETDDLLVRFDKLAGTGIISATRHQEALRASFVAREERVRLDAEQRTLQTQIAALDEAARDAAVAIADLQRHYADGLVVATRGGAVGARVPSVGSVYRAGEPMLSIYSGDAYVLTYLPSRYLFQIEPGMKVAVTSGRHHGKGVISAILPVSDALPQEFQNTFKPRDRNQLARIRLDDPAAFPVFEKVTISRSYF